VANRELWFTYTYLVDTIQENNTSFMKFGNGLKM